MSASWRGFGEVVGPHRAGGAWRRTSRGSLCPQTVLGPRPPQIPCELRAIRAALLYGRRRECEASKHRNLLLRCERSTGLCPTADRTPGRGPGRGAARRGGVADRRAQRPHPPRRDRHRRPRWSDAGLRRGQGRAGGLRPRPRAPGARGRPAQAAPAPARRHRLDGDPPRRSRATPRSDSTSSASASTAPG